MTIHKRAVISSQAELAEGVEVGAYAIIEAGVKIGKGTKIYPHAYVSGDTKIGTGCQIFPFATVGIEPQDLKYKGEAAKTFIGNNTVIREHASIHRGTQEGGMETHIGENCLVMSCAHVAHDCLLGDHVILANAVLLAGHCELGDHVFVGGNAVMQQYLKVGAHAFIGGTSALAGHVPPYSSVFGIPATWTGVNVVGLSRRGFDSDAIKLLRKFYMEFFKMAGTAQARTEQLEGQFSSEETKAALAFIKECAASKHSMVQGRRT